MKHDYRKGPLERGPRGAFTRHSGPPHTACEHYTWTVQGDGTNMAQVADWHAKRNFNGPGYHLMIHEDGSREYGRPLWARGAGARGHNDRVIHVVWTGGRKAASQDGHDTRTAAQIKALDAVYTELRAQFPTITRICGHRALTPTQCPGYDVEAWRAGRPQEKRPEALAVDAGSAASRESSGWGALIRRLAAWLGGRT